jgi:hypothetical protein
MKYSFVVGYTFQRTPESKFSFTPQIVVSYERFNNVYSMWNGQVGVIDKVRYITLVDLNLTFRYKKLITGINSNGLMVGYQNSKFKLQVTNFYSNNGGSGMWISLSDHTHIMTRQFHLARPTYFGSISLRYIFRKDESVKMPGFSAN